MNKQLLLSEFLTTPWALMPERLQAMSSILTRWSAGEPPSDETLFQVNTDRVLRDTRKQMAAASTGTGIAVLPLYGVVTQRGNMVDDISGPGSTSTQQFTSVLRQMLADDTVGQILIDIDSPGGSVYGVAELASEIVKARAQKPVIAVANSLAASAAYWIGCSASEFYVTPGGEVGSIGVWQAHFDYSKALEEEGVKPTLISAGKFKVEGNPYVPLDEQAHPILFYQDLVGAKVTRKRTLLKYLDAVNFASGANPTADPSAEFADDVYFIDRKSRETRDVVEFELAAAFDLEGVSLPRRQIVQNVCPWQYRGAECGYTGTAYFNANDETVSSRAQDACGKRLVSCQKRFGANAELPFGGFPAAGLIR